MKDVIGVESVESGYIGGTTQNPTYKEVCTGNTGHAEAVKVTYDADTISYAELLDMFLGTHDPTQLNRQGNDVGTQYRSAIFPLDAKQQEEAEAAIGRWNAANGAMAVTTIEGMSDGDLVFGRGLSSGLLGRRRPAQSLLPGEHSAQADEATQELPEIRQGRRLIPPAPRSP